VSDTIQIPAGMVVCTTYGSIMADTAFCLLETRSHSEKEGLLNVEWRQVPGALVDRARNDAMRAMLASQAQWLLFLDGDMTFSKDTILRMLRTAYGSHPHFDVVGAYCNLRGDLALPTIDTGTGTWESWYPGQGVVEVMRTGGACILVKRHVAERVPPPWFALRVPQRPLDAIAEVDTFCRTIFDGRNPFRSHPDAAWERMVQAAATHDSARNTWVAAEVGEDSSFCDRVTGMGLRICVDTDIEIQHVDRVVKTARDHRKAMDERAKQDRLLSGFTE
jgi:hypothetical protein